MLDSCALIVFAKAPVPGYAKTRLIAALGADGAAQLAERMLEATVRVAVAARTGRVELCCAPDTQHPAFERLAAQHGVTLTLQGDGDLGMRMHRAFKRTLRTHRHAVLIGTDAPGLDATFLSAAAHLLTTNDAVFGPATDGGYTLVGLSRAAPELFEGMAWSTADVMRETRVRLARLGLRHAELPQLADVDTPADLHHLPRAWRAEWSAEPAPHTTTNRS